MDISTDEDISDGHGFGFSDDDREVYELLLQESKKHEKVDNFMEIIDKYDEVDFKAHFRLKRSTVNILIGMPIVPNWSLKDFLYILVSCRQVRVFKYYARQ